MDSETILLKTEYATNKSYTIKLEQDIFDLETSLKIQKQKNKINSQEGSLNGTHPNEQYENIKTLMLEQRLVCWVPLFLHVFSGPVSLQNDCHYH
jgi:hypothetical protein